MRIWYRSWRLELLTNGRLKSQLPIPVTAQIGSEQRDYFADYKGF